MTRLLALLLLLAPSAFAQAADPAAAVGAFYGVYQGQGHGGIPDATGRLRWSAVLSPRLNKQLSDAAASQARLAAHIKAGGPKAAVMPGLEGDIFTALFDGATSWKVGACSGDAKAQRCSVALAHAAARAGDKPYSWTDTLAVVNTPAGWKVDDVAYDPDFAFGNTGRLSTTLQMVISLNP